MLIWQDNTNNFNLTIAGESLHVFLRVPTADWKPIQEKNVPCFAFENEKDTSFLVLVFPVFASWPGSRASLGRTYEAP